MVKIEAVEKIKTNMDLLDYHLTGKAQDLLIYRKDNTRMDVDGDTDEVRFYQRVNITKKYQFIKSYSFPEFAVITSDWIKKHKKGE